MTQILVELQDSMGSDASIANSGWTSTYNKDRREKKYDAPGKVSDFIWNAARDGHSTPFESVVFRFWFRWPIFTDRQHMTHRIASHNGLSGRYRTLPSDWFSIPADVRGILGKVDPNFAEDTLFEYDELMRMQQEFYRRVLDTLKNAEQSNFVSNKEYKRCREVLRGVIGTAAMVERTTMINLRSFANYMRLRNSEHAQAEIRTAAQMMLQQVQEANICPVALEALEKYGWQI